MLKLNRDVIYLIFQKLQDEKNTLCSCLLVNKTWCEIIISILWKNPWKYLKKGNDKLLLKMIISHLSDKSRIDFLSKEINFLKDSYQKPLFNYSFCKFNEIKRIIKEINLLKDSYQKPLFNYISFCKHLNFNEIIKRIINNPHLNFKEIKRIINNYTILDGKSEISTSSVENEIFSLFINGNINFTHLYIPHQFNLKIHLIPEAKLCFSNLQFISCNTSINDDFLAGLIEICNSVKELELFIDNDNYEIVKLINASRKLSKVHFLITPFYSLRIDILFREVLENSLIEHANSIQYFILGDRPVTNILSSFVNLRILELDNGLRDMARYIAWDCLENLSLPFLQILRTKSIPVEVLTSLIEKTNGHLIEININYFILEENSNKGIIQAIYQNCPNLKYLKLLFYNSNALELEKLLIECQHLNGLYIIFDDVWASNDMINWNHLFEILTKLSPTGLFKFKFHLGRIDRRPKLPVESLKLFFDNWKDRHPMLLQTTKLYNNCIYLIEKYKAEGIIKKYDILHSVHCDIFEDFEWIQKRFN